MAICREDLEKEIEAAKTSIKTAETIKELSKITLKAFEKELSKYPEKKKGLNNTYNSINNGK